MLAGRLITAWRIVGRTFGRPFAPALFILITLLRLAAVEAGLLLDWIFCPALRRKDAQSPLVIVGSPRSGTTFLHRFIAGEAGFRGVTVWRMIFPSLLLERVMRPFKRALAAISPVRHHAEGPHPTSLDSVETEDGALFLRFFDGLLFYCYFLAWDDRDWLPEMENLVVRARERDARWLETLWKRNLAATCGERAVAKFFSLSGDLPYFMQRFTGARVIYVARDPLETLPSTLSLVTGVLDRRFGFWNLPDGVRCRYIRRICEALQQLSRRFVADLSEGRIDRTRLLVIPYRRLMTDFDGVMSEVVTFAGISTDAALAGKIAKTAEAQKAYRSGHGYDLGRFGLTEERVRADYAFFYEAFPEVDS